MSLRSLVTTSFALLSGVSADHFPPTLQGVTTKQAPSHPGVSISYKETCICETEARAWAGYVHMPISYLSDIEGSDPYNISMFFWYFEARNDPKNAPAAIYLAGGAGESSMYGVTGDAGPCYVQADSNTTATNQWSWNEHVNMLYIDQPVSTGFSYDTLINSTLDLLFLGEPLTETGITPISEYNGTVPASNTTFLYGILPSQNPNHTANSSAIAARTLWHFAQVWFEEFPEYQTYDRRISIWGNSYGGYWATSTAAYFQQQNVRIANGDLDGSHILLLDTVGITNGCVDQLYQNYWYPDMAYNNTYDLQVIPLDVYEESKTNFTKPGGCRDLILKCRELGEMYDPDQLCINATVNKACLLAEEYCGTYVQGPYDVLSNRSDFDMAHMKPDPFPPSYTAGFFNQQWVQQELGVPLNFTADSTLDNNIFFLFVGDAARTPGMKNVEYLLSSGIKVTFIYGDRDYRCPWLGMEKFSLQANWTDADAFRNAGYEFVHINRTYNGGVVRQRGNLSFTRVFEAGHDTGYYQPETVYEIFNRAMFSKDVATGRLPTSGPFNNYTTQGPSSSLHIKNELPPVPPPACYLYNIGATCTLDQYEALVNGTAEVVDFNIVKPVGGGGPLPPFNI